MECNASVHENPSRSRGIRHLAALERIRSREGCKSAGTLGKPGDGKNG